MNLDTIVGTQRQIVFEKRGKFVVRACPGSGKTYTVAARIAHRASSWEQKHKGIAAISFTNIACEEIADKLKCTFDYGTIKFPHFLGTIDSFVNRFIFLPFGHLFMGTTVRPILVGEPHGTWNSGKYERDYDRYFDIVSFGKDDELLYPEIPNTFFFSYNQIIKKDGTESLYATNLREMKNKFWRQGYATQRDANYFAMKILEKHPCIAKTLVKRFPEMIVDEAQDTSAVQMRILDILIENGLNELILVGDPDQAIFEWNDAKPELFNQKYSDWRDNSIVLNENRRSSQNICNFTGKLATLDSPSIALTNEIKDFSHTPLIKTYTDNNEAAVIDDFISQCTNNGIAITPENVAVLSRSTNFISKLCGNANAFDNKIIVWNYGDNITKDIALSKYLIEKRQTAVGYKILEKVFIKITEGMPFCSQEQYKKVISSMGFVRFRTYVNDFAQELPSTNELGIITWVGKVNQIFKLNLTLSKELKNDISISEIFRINMIHNEKPYQLSNVHSVKGKTFEATLLFLKKKGVGEYYKTLLKNGCTLTMNEELRIIYVAITRPRKLLIMAVPDVDNEVWSNYFYERS
jgi:superfamily I DNA/RNA helicase